MDDPQMATERNGRHIGKSRKQKEATTSTGDPTRHGTTYAATEEVKERGSARLQTS